jgi:hypothetical protein
MQDRDRMQIRSALNKLVEWWHAIDRDREKYEDFVATNRPPEPPDKFENFQDLVDFHSRKEAYESAIERHESTLATDKAQYEKAASILRDVLPENVTLHYTYEEGHSSYEGIEYQIEHRQGDVFILAYRRPTTSP